MRVLSGCSSSCSSSCCCSERHRADSLVRRSREEKSRFVVRERERDALLSPRSFDITHSFCCCFLSSPTALASSLGLIPLLPHKLSHIHFGRGRSLIFASRWESTVRRSSMKTTRRRICRRPLDNDRLRSCILAIDRRTLDGALLMPTATTARVTMTTMPKRISTSRRCGRWDPTSSRRTRRPSRPWRPATRPSSVLPRARSGGRTGISSPTIRSIESCGWARRCRE